MKENGLQNLPEKEGVFSDISEIEGQVGVFIISAKNRTGAIEDFLLEYLEGLEQDEPGLLTNCVLPFIECANRNTQIKKPSKAKLLAYFVGRSEYISSIGQAANQKIWNFDSDHFKELRSFLSQFRKG